jgi:hypothetical protein
MKQRIEGTDTLISAITKMAEGNPGAVAAMLDVSNKAAIIDPDNFLGLFGPILSLDSFGIYGTGIYILYNDMCNKDASKTIAILRACQLGLFDSALLKVACSRQDGSGTKMVPVEDLCSEVKKELPSFNFITP